jgi:hypothetical protein
LGFTMADAEGAALMREVRTGAMAFTPANPAASEVVFQDPFPFGVTAVPRGDSTGRTFAQADVPLADGAFPIRDSVPPVVVGATIVPNDPPWERGTRILVKFSEPLRTVDFVSALQGKHPGGAAGSLVSTINPIMGVDGRSLTFQIDSVPFNPEAGDSLALSNSGMYADLWANAPRKLVFHALSGLDPEAVAPRRAEGNAGRPLRVRLGQGWGFRKGGGIADARGARVPAADVSGSFPDP